MRIQFQPNRQKLSLKGDTANRALDDLSTLSSLGITTDGELVVKDLGPQISWKIVFLTEYVPLFTQFFMTWLNYGTLTIAGRTFDYTSAILSLPCILLWKRFRA